MELVNKDIKMLDPFSPNLTLEQKEAILEECKVNPVYFYDRVLGIKASRMTWDVIRTLQNYPKEKPGDHDGDMLGGDFICEPGIAIARKRGLGEDRRYPRTEQKGVKAGNRNWSQNQLANMAGQAWNLTCKNFDHQEIVLTNDVVIDTFATMIGQYPTGEHEVRLDSLCWNEQHSSIWKATPGFAYRKRGVGDWVKLDYTPSVKVPQAFTTATLYGPMDPVELRKLAVTAWNILVERNIGRFTVTEAMYEEQFRREIGLTVGSDRVKVEVRAGEPSFFYRRNDQWIPL